MYVYELETSYYDDDNIYLGVEWVHLTHSTKYSKEEFNNICEKALKEVGDKCNTMSLFKVLTTNYGFNELEIESKFEYSVKD